MSGQSASTRWVRAAREGVFDGLHDFDSFVLTFVLLLWFGWWGLVVRLALVPVSVLWSFLLTAVAALWRSRLGTRE